MPDPQTHGIRTALASAGVGTAALLLAAAAAAPALADSHGNGNGNGNNGNHYGQNKQHDNNGHSSNDQSNNGKSSNDAGSTASSDDSTSTGHNPPGNNGTVKIHDAYGDLAHHNVPHVDCDFAVAFWGFDDGQTMDVSFAGQAPTGKGTALTVTGAPTSITSTDDAGGGQDYDGELDFRADQLNLASLGAPHPKQGYHIKLTVDTFEPGGHKYKVFWLQPCAQPPAAGTQSSSTQSSTTPGSTSTGTSQSQGAIATSTGESSGAATKSSTTSDTSSVAPTEVLGRRITRSSPTAVAPAAASLPFTGAEIGGMAAAAAIALGSGVALTVAGRRRRTARSVSES